MRRFFIFAASLVLALGAVSCHDDPVPEDETPEVEFKLLDNSAKGVNLASDAAQSTFRFSAPGEWTIIIEDTKASSWLSVSPQRGKAGEEITVTLQASVNTGSQQRKARVDLGCNGDHLFFTVTQAAPEPVVIPVQRIDFSPAGPLELMVGDVAVIDAIVEPRNATDKSINWSLDTEGIVSAVFGESSCTITALSAGSVNLTAKAGDKTAVLNITVTEIPAVLPESISLNLSEFEITVGGSFFLYASISPADVTDPTVVWTSSDSNIATIENGEVKGINPGEATITATTCNGLTATCQVIVVPTMENGHEYIDFRLPSGTMWAASNLGAANPRESGSYFAWGETQPKDSYTWDNYTLGLVDGLVYLELEDDAASALWGGLWQIPGQEQWQELIDNTSFEFYSDGSSSGVRFYKEVDGKTIEMFVPRAGYVSGPNLMEDGINPYWTNRTDYEEGNSNSSSSNARVFRILSNTIDADSTEPRHLGLPVRAVFTPLPVK